MKLFSRIAFAAVVALLMAACSGSETTYQYKTQYLPVQLVGSEKYQYVLAFEFISVFLLACIIGGLVVSRKEEDK